MWLDTGEQNKWEQIVSARELLLLPANINSYFIKDNLTTIVTKLKAWPLLKSKERCQEIS